MKEKIVKLSEANELLLEGDILLFRGRSLASFFIRRVVEGKYSHVGLLSSHCCEDQKMWECVEFLEWKGGRTTSLDIYVNLYNGSIDVFRVVPNKTTILYDEKNKEVKEFVTPLDPYNITYDMRRLTGLAYGWKRILIMAHKKIPFLRFFYKMDKTVDDSLAPLVYPVCSTAVAYVFTKNGFDLVHHRSIEQTDPSDIARSSLTNYLFTIVK